MSLSGLIGYKIAKFLYTYNSNNLHLNDRQSKVIMIYRNLLGKSDSEMFVAPLSGKKFLKWKDITAMIIENSIIIINHKYYYDIPIPMNIANKLARKFDLKLERRRTLFENELHANISSSLNEILTEITNKK